MKSRMRIKPRKNTRTAADAKRARIRLEKIQDGEIRIAKKGQ